MKNIYDYVLPKKNLALTPASPRDSSKLFIYNTKTNEIIFDHFYNLDQYLPKNSFLVLNNTKVIPARVLMRKENGGKIMVLFLVNELTTSSSVIKVLVDRKITVGEKVFFDDKNFLKVINQQKNIFYLEFDFDKEKLFALLEKHGAMPVPLYLKKTPLKKEELFEKYQTIFAQLSSGRKLASAAAPTASLHFTKRVFSRLEKKGIKNFFITLHIGLGTFAPVTQENLKAKKLHEEYYEISEKTLHYINIMKSEGKKLVAVGTTVVRTLEDLARIKIDNQKSKIFNKTDLFIFPPFDFKMVDVLITNFHLPKSSLMMLVDAFLQHKGVKRHLFELYNIAIKNNFRFYSFGDSMIIL